MRADSVCVIDRFYGRPKVAIHFLKQLFKDEEELRCMMQSEEHNFKHRGPEGFSGKERALSLWVHGQF